jgi:hypothetical protein
MRAWLALALLVLLLVGCGPAPRPFQSDNPGANSLLLLPDRGGIAVARATGAVHDDGEALSIAMAEALRGENVPADLGTGNRESRWLLAHVERDEAQGAQGASERRLRIAWELFEADGSPLFSYEHRLAVSPVAWDRGDPALLENISTSAAPRIARQIQRAGAAEAKLPGYPPGTGLVVADVAGSDAKAATALTRSMRRMLDQRGLPLTETARPGDVVIAGRLDLRDPLGSLVPIEIVWQVRRAGRDGQAGKTIGDLRQANQLPESELAQGWPRLANLIVQAATPDLLRVLESGASSGDARR